jgi:hypothetical protein
LMVGCRVRSLAKRSLRALSSNGCGARTSSFAQSPEAPPTRGSPRAKRTRQKRQCLPTSANHRAGIRTLEHGKRWVRQLCGAKLDARSTSCTQSRLYRRTPRKEAFVKGISR